MAWILLTLLNVFGNGTALFLWKRQTNGKLHYISVVLISLFFSTVTLFPFALYSFLQKPILFTNPVGLLFYSLSVIFNIIGFYLLIKAISLNELSFFGPLETLRPFFVVLLSLFLFHEQPTLLLIIGICFIVIGAFVLQMQKRLDIFIVKLFHSNAPLFVVGSAIAFAITSVVDKHALSFIHPFPYSFLVTLGITCGFVLLHLIFSEKIIMNKFFNPTLIFSGVILTVGQLGIYTALTMASPNVVIPVQMTRSLFLSILGFVFLKEKDYLKKIIAAILMLIGVFLITR